MRAILLNPGPVTLSEGVRRAALADDLCHRESEYCDLQDDVIHGLLAVYGCDRKTWRCIVLGGSGTQAMEAMVASLVPAEGRLLVLENGVYGERFSRIAAIHDIDHEAETVNWISEWPMDTIEQRLAEGNFSHVAAVHHETTTGRLNPILDLAELCGRHGVQLLVDAVSSFGAEDVPFEHDAVAAVSGTANKCLHGIPGASFVVVRKSALADAAHPRSLTLHLPLWARHQAQQATPFTPPVPSLLALRQALAELEDQGGWQSRRARYRYLGERVRRSLEALEVEALLPVAECSSVLRSYGLRAGFTYNDVHDGLKQRGFVIHAGQGDLADRMFQVAVMGDISDYDIARLEYAFQSVFDSNDDTP